MSENRIIHVGDNHGHLNPLEGMGVENFAKKFRASGGWLYVLVNLLSWNFNIRIKSPQDYRKLYDITISTAKELRRSGLIVPVIIGPHPAEATKKMEEGVEPSEVAELMIKAYELAAKYVKLGRAQGLGEAGRPHWPVSKKVMDTCTEIMFKAIELAAELDVPLHLHLDAGKKPIELAAQSARKVGASKVVVHHVRGELAYYAAYLGLVPSVPARRNEILAAKRAWDKMVVESDFLDDPRRPGAVVAPWSISKTFRRLLNAGQMSCRQAEKILVHNPAKLYSVKPVL